MRKTLVYIILLAILGFGVYYFLFSNRDQSFSSDEAGFTVKDTAAVGKIFIAGPDGSSILLERTDSAWMVNKKYKALMGTLGILMKTLTKQVPVSPVNKAQYNNVIKGLASSSIKVEIYNRNGEKMRVFYVGSEASGMAGSYMMMGGAKTPYVVNMPGFQGYLTPVYSYNIKDWRDRTVINLAQDHLVSVSVQYPDHPENSFTLVKDHDAYKVVADKAIMALGPLNERHARVYAKYFQNLNCEAYTWGNHDVDSILKIMPKRCAVEVTGTNGYKQHLDVYWLPLNRRSKNMNLLDPNIPDNDRFDADHFFAVMNDYKDTAVITSNVFTKVFRKAYEFFQADDAETEQAPLPAEQHKDQPLLPVPPANMKK